MRTLVISDLHLGARSDVDVLRRPAAQNALLAALDGIERLVILGDLLELRHGPMHDALEAARPVLKAVGEALATTARSYWCPATTTSGSSRRGWSGGCATARAAGPGGACRARASTATRAIARMVQPASLDVVYPGPVARRRRLRHPRPLPRPPVTVPSFERLGAGARRASSARRRRATGPDDYEVVLAPMYALLDAVAPRVGDGRAAAPGDVSARAWQRLSSTASAARGRGRVRGRRLPAGHRRAEQAGIGPLKADLSGAELRRASLRAMGEVVERLGIDARNVIFGHTHRTGPHPDDERPSGASPAASRSPTPGPGSTSAYLDRHWGSPYLPGGAIELIAGREPGARAPRRADPAALSGGTAPGVKQVARHVRPGPTAGRSHPWRGGHAGEQPRAGRVDRDRRPVDHQLPGAVEHGPHRAGGVGAAVGAGLVGRGPRSAPSGRPRGAGRRAARARPPSSSWIASSVSA